MNNYRLSVKDWVEKTDAIGLKAKAGRYGGTYAHKDIAFEFGMWISAEFKIYLILFISERIPQGERLAKLNKIAIEQMRILAQTQGRIALA